MEIMADLGIETCSYDRFCPEVELGSDFAEHFINMET